MVTAATFGLMLTAGGVGSSGSAMAATVTWAKNASGAWWTASNWSSAPTLPGPSDDVILNRPVHGWHVTVSANTSVNSLTSYEYLEIKGVTFSFAAPSAINGTLDMFTGTLTGTADLTLGGVAFVGPATIGGTGKMTILPDAVLSVDTTTATVPAVVDQRSIDNAGWVSVRGGLELRSATLTNQAGATVNLYKDLSGSGSLVSAGTVNKASNSVGGIGTANFTSTGTLNVQGGELWLYSNSTLSGAINVNPGATLRVAGATTLSPSTAVSGSLTLGSGTLTIPGDNSFPDVTWIGGTLTGAGKTTVAPGQRFAIQMNSWMGASLTGRTLENAGTITFSGNSWPSWTLDGGAAFNNLAGATFDAASGSIASGAGGGTFANAGTLNVTGPLAIAATLSNAGDINVRPGGSLSLTGSGTSTGTLNVDPAGASLTFAGNYTLAPTAVVNGPYTLGSGTLTILGDNAPTDLTWAGGTLAGAGKTTLAPGAHFALSTSWMGRSLSGRTLENAGTINWPNDTFVLTAGAVLSNLPGATFNSAGGMVGDVYSIAAGTLSNAGTLNVNAPLEIWSTFDNAGTVNVQAGASLTLIGGGTLSGVINVDPAASGPISFSGGTYNIDPAATFNGPVVLNADTLNFTGDSIFPDGFTWNSGQMTGAGKTTVADGRTLAINPSPWAPCVLSGHTLENAGTINLNATSTNALSLASATIRNLAGGTINAYGEAGATSGRIAQTGDGGSTVENQGTLNKSGAFSWTMAVPFNNSGTVNITGGQLRLDNGGTQSGSVTASDAAALVFSGGTHVITPAATFAGPVILQGATLSYTGDNSAPSGFLWQYGTLTGAGKTTNPAGNTLVIDPAPGTATLDSRDFDNAGTINLNATSNGLTLNSSTLRNLPGATINATSDLQFFNGGYVSGGGGSTKIDNAGTVNKTGTRSWNVYVDFSNTGTLNVQAGSLGLHNVTQLSGTTLTGGTWNVSNNATLGILFGSNIATIGPAASVTLDGPNASFAKINSLNNVQGSLTLSGGKSFTTTGALTNSGAIAVGTGSTLKVAGTFASSGALTNSGTIDIVGNRMILNYASASPADWLRGQLLSGRNGGAWAGAAGVVSSTAAGDALKRKAIGYAEASDLGVTIWAGVTVDATALLTKVTWYGDANLDGKVNADDYALLDRGFAKGLTGAHWTDGDFNYDGTVDQADYLLADRVYAQQVGVLSPELLADREARFGSAYVTELVTSVPEPTTLASSLAALGGMLAVRRRGRK